MDRDGTLIEKSSCVEDKDGVKFVEHWRLEKINGTTPLDRYNNALAKLPRVGEARILNGQVMLCRSRQLTPRNLETFEAVIEFTSFQISAAGAPPVGQPPRIEVFGVVTQAQTNVDADGRLIEIDPPDQFENAQKQTPTVNYEAPQFGLRYTRRVSSEPSDKAARFVGTINDRTFSGRPAGTWLCRAVRGTSDDGGQTYTEVIEMTYNPRGWNARLYWEDSSGNRYGQNESGDPYIIQVYPREDFNDLVS